MIPAKLKDKLRVKKMRVTPRNPAIEIKVQGNRDPRGPDNSIFIWLEEDDTLHIGAWKTSRCYAFREIVVTRGHIEVIAD